MPRAHSCSADSRRLAGVIATILALCCGPANAAEWSLEPKITTNYKFDDNIRLVDSDDEQVEVSGAEIDALIRVRASTPRTSFLFAPRIRSTFFPGEEDSETNNGYLRTNLRNKGERYLATIDANYFSVETFGTYFPESTVTLEDLLLGNPEAGAGVGRSPIKNREDKLEIIPRALFELAERHALALRATFLDVSFDREVQGDQENYSDIYAAVAYQFKFSPTSTVELTTGASRFKQDGASDTKAGQVSAQWTTKYSETSEYYVRGGVNRAEADTGWENGILAGAGVRWSFEVTDIFLDASRDLTPDSSGQIIERGQLRFQLQRKLSPVTTLQLGARGIKDRAPGDRNQYDGREYVTGSIGMRWRVSRQFSLGGDYTYVWREYDSSVDPAEANRFTLGVTYEPSRR